MNKVLLGRKIVLIRTMRKMTQKTLAKKVGLCVSAIGTYERGEKMPSFETAVIIAETLNVDLKWLAYGKVEFSGANAPDIKEDGI